MVSKKHEQLMDNFLLHVLASVGEMNMLLHSEASDRDDFVIVQGLPRFRFLI